MEYFHPTFISPDFSVTSGLNFGCIYENLILNATEFDLVKQKPLYENEAFENTVYSACQRKCLLSCHEYIE